MNLDREFWEERYQSESTPWDAGSITRPLKEYAEQLLSRDLRILIPGAGNAHEAAWLWEQGFKGVHVLDWSGKALENFQQKLPSFPSTQLIEGDFFKHEGEYDLILEQTFFCALPPKRRADYARQMANLLAPTGKLVGLLFSFPLTEQGPPFGGSTEEYLGYFSPIFNVKVLEPCYNSIKPRSGNELFLIAVKKSPA